MSENSNRPEDISADAQTRINNLKQEIANADLPSARLMLLDLLEILIKKRAAPKPDLIESVEGLGDLREGTLLKDRQGEIWVNLPPRCRDLQKVGGLITAHRFLKADVFPFTVLHRPGV